MAVTAGALVALAGGVVVRGEPRPAAANPARPRRTPPGRGEPRPAAANPAQAGANPAQAAANPAQAGASQSAVDQAALPTSFGLPRRPEPGRFGVRDRPDRSKWEAPPAPPLP
jgi:hypothetical protein